MARSLTKVQNLLRLIDLLRSRPMSSRDLAAELELGQRKIQRYLRELSSDYPELDRDDRGRYSLPKVDRSGELNRVEALAVHSATRLLLHHTRSKERHYWSALGKLATRLPEPARLQLERSLERHKLKTGEPSQRNLELVAEAWFSGRVMKFSYTAPIGSGKPHPYEFETYFVEVSPVNLLTYVIGLERSYFKHQVTLLLDRISNASLTDERYQIPAEFDASAYLEHAWGVVGGRKIEVLIRLSEQGARHLAESFVRAAVVEEKSESGELFLRLTAGVDKHGIPIDLVPWLLSWGEQVEVLEPVELRAYLARRLGQAARQYGRSSP